MGKPRISLGYLCCGKRKNPQGIQEGISLSSEQFYKICYHDLYVKLIIILCFETSIFEINLLSVKLCDIMFDRKSNVSIHKTKQKTIIIGEIEHSKHDFDVV